MKSFYGVDSDEDMIARVLMKQGPLAIAISDKLLHFYKDNVLKGEGCDGDPDHAVVLVGFGTDPDGQKYWIVKNSFGEDWGKNGYFHLERGVGACGMNKDVTAVEVKLFSPKP